MRFIPVFASLGVLLPMGLAAQTTVTYLVDDFESEDLTAWQTSMSPAYYKGGTDRQGLEIVRDPERGHVLRCDLRFVDAKGSEPAFITRRLDPRPRVDVIGVRFFAKLTDAAIAPDGGFRLRLRTSDRAFNDFDVQDALGRDFPVGTWVHVQLDTAIGPNVRNVWNTVFSGVRQMTFRLDDIDRRNAQFALFLDDIELVLRQPV